jgi:NADPH-dependent curcumin reductase CurA
MKFFGERREFGEAQFRNFVFVHCRRIVVWTFFVFGCGAASELGPPGPSRSVPQFATRRQTGRPPSSNKQMNRQILFVERPAPGPIPSTTFRLNEAPIPNLTGKQVLVKTTYTSCDPAMRGWMSEARSYIKPVQVGEVMRAGCVGVVLESKNAAFKPGDAVSGFWGWQEYAAVEGGLEKLDLQGASLSDAISILGATGQTAYWGLMDVGKPKSGETVVVSGAAGATGMVVAQLAKAVGCKVVGIAGGKDKCEWLKNELGLDYAIDYKDKNWKKHFVEATPKFVDVYFDNVGGEILDMALARIAQKGRIVVCGAIATYNSAVPVGPKNYMTLISQRAKMEGFIVFDYANRYAEARKHMVELMKQGKLKNHVTIVRGLENAPSALNDLFAGKNLGKMLVEVSPSPKL